MKKIISTLLLAALASSASAQMADYASNIQLNLGGGIHTLRYGLRDGDHHIGFGGLLEAQYQLMFNRYVGVGLGVQASTLASSATYNFTIHKTNVMLPGAVYPADVLTRFYKWRERQNVINLSVPVQLILRAPVSVKYAFQFGLGATIDHPLSSTYKTVDGAYIRNAYMPQTNVRYSDMDRHLLGTYEPDEEGSFKMNNVSVGLLADMGCVINLSKGAGLYLGVYGNYTPYNVVENSSVNLFDYDASTLNYSYLGTMASDRVKNVNPLEAGIKVGLRFGVGKELGWREREAAELAAAAQARADSIAAAEAAEAARLAAEERAREEAVAQARAEAEARAKAQADSLAAVHAAELAKAKAEAEAARQKAEAEAAKAKSEAEAARLKAEAEAAKARAEAEAAKQKAEAEAKAKAETEARAKAEAEARAKAEAEARAKAKAEQKAREEAAFVAGFTDTAFFETGKDMPIFGQLNEDSWDNLKDIMDRHPEIMVTVTGHTDNVGKASSNLDLSKRRAENIKKMLVSKGIAADRVTAIGKGQTQPIATNSTADGRARNRRIVITIGK